MHWRGLEELTTKAQRRAGVSFFASIVGVVLSGDLAVATSAADNSSTVTVTLSSGTFSNGSNTVSAQAVNGVATFDNLVINSGRPRPPIEIHAWGDLMWAHGAAALALSSVTERLLSAQREAVPA